MTNREKLEEMAREKMGQWLGPRIKLGIDEDLVMDLADFAERVQREERKRCADLADASIQACITDEERDIATTIRNLILAGGVSDARERESAPKAELLPLGHEFAYAAAGTGRTDCYHCGRPASEHERQ